jgi:para-nitrobenzyl esterase
VKKFGVLLLFFGIIFALANPVFAVIGDVTGDGKDDTTDAITALQALVGLPTPNLHVDADVNQDGKIGMAEVIYILQNIGGLRTDRNTLFGKVEGFCDATNSAFAWLGIPYAAPPVGPRRWMAPIDPTPWTTTLSAKVPGKACMQQGTVSDRLLGTIRQSEDCLTLNIWSPTSGENNLPVIVYVHGGSNVTGYGAMNGQWGGTMASEQKVVFVSINYRLNLFGWLNHTAMKTGDTLSDSGNFGTLDIIQALKFVKNNIANFGGDPNNVTLAGESAGSGNVWSLVISPKAAGLFHKAMTMSFGVSASTTPANGQTFADTLLQQIVIRDGLSTNVAGASTYLASLTAKQIKDYLYGQTALSLISMLTNSTLYSAYAGVPPTRFMDGVVQPPDSATAFTGSFLNNVPMLAGNTNEEGKTWGAYFAKSGQWSTLNSFINSFTPDSPNLAIEDIIQSQYLPASKAFTSCSNAGYNALTLNAAYVYGNSATYCSNGHYNTTFFWWHQTHSLNGYQPLQPKTYAYNFAWAQQPEPMKTIIGASHATDIDFMFGNTGTNRGNYWFPVGFSTANKPGRDALSLKMRQSLAAFMRTGDPNNASLGVTWLPWSSTSGGANRLVFDADYNNAIITMTTSNTPIPR